MGTIWVAQTRGPVGAERAMGEEEHNSTLSPHSRKDSFLAGTLITNLIVARNGLLRMIGPWKLLSMPKTTNPHGMMNLPT